MGRHRGHPGLLVSAFVAACVIACRPQEPTPSPETLPTAVIASAPPMAAPATSTAAATPAPTTSTPQQSPAELQTATPATDWQPAMPIRAAFYYPWFPQAWDQQGTVPYTNYTPALGFYDSADPDVIRRHVEAMAYGHIKAGIVSWWGQGHHTDQRLPVILTATAGDTFRWSIYYEPEGQGDPSTSTLAADLTYLHDRYGDDPSYLRHDGRFVVFVYADPSDGCGMAERWTAANTVGAYIVLKVFPNYRNCSSQPQGWHQYAPAVAADAQVPYSYTISPGFWKSGESPRLARDLMRWNANLRDMISSGARFQLITTFNEWGEGSAIEPAEEWTSDSGFGAYLDALHNNGVATAVTTTQTPIPADATRVLVGAGDIADCDSTGDEATASLLDSIRGTVFTTGDNAYEEGTAAEYANCYDTSWGRHKARTRPSAGNHDYLTDGAAGYFAYFGAAAGDPATGYYSYDLGEWHVVVLNTNCSQVGGCSRGSTQEQWLRADLGASASLCTLAYFHHPRWSSGKYQVNDSVAALYEAMYDYGVELAITGHAHNYERFAPLDPAGNLDRAQGIRQIVVGTGGKNHRSVSVNVLPHSEVRNDDTFGVLKLTLERASYTWEFVPVSGMTFSDSGHDACH